MLSFILCVCVCRGGENRFLRLYIFISSVWIDISLSCKSHIKFDFILCFYVSSTSFSSARYLCFCSSGKKAFTTCFYFSCLSFPPYLRLLVFFFERAYQLLSLSTLFTPKLTISFKVFTFFIYFVLLSHFVHLPFFYKYVCMATS